MPKQIIKDGKIIEDSWHWLSEIEDLQAGQTQVLVPLALWQSHKAALKAQGPVGVILACDEPPENIAEDLAALSLIALEFPAFTDGRAYSYAYLLRNRYDFQGEIRAVGDVLQDQLFYMQRCGINAYALKEGKSMEAALKALSTFSHSYQASADQTLPLFRQRQG